MIPINYINEWREHAPWSYQSQIEQDLVLSRALVNLYQNPNISASLAFRGGTALNKLFCTRSARYSEDIDLVQMHDVPIGEVMSTIREVLDPWLGKPRWDQKKHSVRFVYRFHSEDEPKVPLRLKVEINTVEPFTVLGVDHKTYSVVNRWFSGEANITTYCLDELMGTKFRALYQRLKGRDLYDLWYALTQLDVSAEQIVKVFKHYNNYHGIKISRAEYESNLAYKVKNIDFLSDAKRVLSPEAKWEPQAAVDVIKKCLVSKLPGTPWKGLREDVRINFDPTQPLTEDEWPE